MQDVFKTTCFVKDENTLCYFQGDMPDDHGWYFAGVLAGSVLRGGHDPKNGSCVWSRSVDTIRIATKEDFDFFRVCSKGYID
jgi:hypothetical protein